MSRTGSDVALTPKAFDLLLVLVRQQGHLPVKDELMKIIWPDRIVAKSNLAKHISMLRQVLSSRTP